MDELADLFYVPEDEDNPQEGQLLLATVGAMSSAGCTLIFDGQTQASQKTYKCLQVGRGSPSAGSRVLVFKQAGTCTVLGAIGSGQPCSNVAPLSSSANLATVISRFNTLLDALQAKSIITTQN